MSIHKTFRVNVRRLNLRAQPGTDAAILVKLDAGQAVVRLDDDDRAGWWFVFADTPGEGIYAGHVWAEFLKPAFGAAELAEAEITPPPPPIPLPDADMPATDEGDGDDSPSREPEGGMIENDPETDGVQPSPPVHELPVWTEGWNPSVPFERRYLNGNCGVRRGNPVIDRVVIHVTGTLDMKAIVNRFTTPSGGASAHYLVMPDGLVHQFVPEEKRAFHAGINKTVRQLYDRRDGSWRQFKRYFSWHKGYPADAIFLDSAMRVLVPSERASAVLVAPATRGEWPDFAYFDRRWGRAPVPLGYTAAGHDPNNNSIGIEILSIGASTPRPDQYSNEMYAALGALIGDICRRHRLPIQHETVCGHEDVNPVERWGWDPHQGFDWDRLLKVARDCNA